MEKLTADSMIGKKFGKLTVIDKLPSDRHGARALCKCDCGATKVAYLYRLKSGANQSCGCTNRDRLTKMHFKHGMTNTRLFRIWSSMRERCTNSNAINYKNYGGRGIAICKEWDEFIPFMEWALSNGYNYALAIDRIDNDGNYSPDNCRWVTPAENSNHKRNSVILSYGGKTQTISQWADEYGIGRSTLRNRILNYGWEISDALNTPVKCGKYKTAHLGSCDGCRWRNKA
jgi:hypothetical protein